MQISKTSPCGHSSQEAALWNQCAMDKGEVQCGCKSAEKKQPIFNCSTRTFCRDILSDTGG